MMLKEKSSPWARMKYLYILPVAAIAVTAFARPEVTSVVEEISAVKVSDLSALVETNRVENAWVDISTDSTPVLEMRMPPASEPVTVPIHAPLLVDTVAPVQEEVVFDVVENMPEFPGGHAAMMQYLSKNIKYPKAAMAAGTQGRVIVQFQVGADGRVSHGNVVRAVDPELDQEALRLVHEMPKWKPGQQRGQNVTVRYTIPVMFRLTPPKDDSSDVRVVSYSSSGSTENNGRKPFYINGAKPLYVVDGKEVEEISNIDAQSLVAVSVLKNDLAIEKYGERAKNGVVEITTNSMNEVIVLGYGPELDPELSAKLAGTPVRITATSDSADKFPMKVSGQITDATGKPIVGALVSVKGSLVGSITDTEGNFSFNAPEDATLVVAYVDMVTVEVKGGTDLKVTLKSE